MDYIIPTIFDAYIYNIVLLDLNIHYYCKSLLFDIVYCKSFVELITIEFV